MEILISYKSIYWAFVVNANVVKVEIGGKVWLYCLLISYDNINFYKQVHNTWIFNHRAQVNYIAGYICFIDFPYSSRDDFLNNFSDSWHNQYLFTSLINCAIVNKYNADNLILLDTDQLYKMAAIQHIMCEILDYYFTKAMQNQKIKLDDI